MGELHRADGSTLDLRDRVAGHALIAQLLDEWDRGRIGIHPTTGVVEIHDEAKGWYQGVLGERRVAHELALLGPEWTVLHSVPVGREQTDIDHVVVGPGGVFTLNTKHHARKSVWIAGINLHVERHPTDYIRKSIAEAKRAQARLARVLDGVPVEPLLVFVDPAYITVEEKPLVRVASTGDLLPWFVTSRSLSPEHIARIVDAACRPSTWHDAPGPTLPGRVLEREFAALESAVTPAYDATVRHPQLTAYQRAPRPARSPQVSARRGAAARPRSAPAARPARKQPRRRTRTRRGRAWSDLVMPLLGLAGLWYVLTNFTAVSAFLTTMLVPR